MENEPVEMMKKWMLVAFLSVAPLSGQNIELEPLTEGAWQTSWTGITGRVYFIQFSLDLEEWLYAPFVEKGDGSDIEYGVFSTAASAFFRLVHTDNFPNGNPMTADFDGDGLSNFFEVSNSGTDPFDTDSDDDAVLDGATDADEDGATNLSEQTAGTNSWNKDHPAVMLKVIVTGS